MRGGAFVAVIIPALDEERAIGRVLKDIPAWVDLVVVVDNGSLDGTAAVARAHAALVVAEHEKGYGAACLRGLAETPAADIIVFLDGDYSDHPEEMASLVDPIAGGSCDMVIGSRVLGNAEQGSLMPQQRFGNWLATWLIRLIWRVRYTDLGPFRAIGRTSLARLAMRDRSYGWTVEMQIKAAIAGLRIKEVPVSYRRRIGVSKVSGTVKGTIKAGYKILSLIGRFAVAPPRSLTEER
jgi:glycosyltransferase involved in cell wall biosynthesis